MSKIQDILDNADKKLFQYQLLDRMKQDCEYYLGYGNRNPMYLWSLEVKEHIQNMKDLWNNFDDDEKPEWLTWEQILDYEKQMLC